MAQAPHPSNPNEPSRNDRLKDLVSRAIALPASDRAGFIASQCADDVPLALEVRELVAAHEAASNFLANPTNSETNAPTALGPITEKPGSRIGPYKLLELIGEGGFGSVFMADQDSPVRRRVALKIIKLGMDTKQVVARFEQERQALALMDHPNIAKVLDAGTTPLTSEGGGRPFFVMEYVKGDPINAFADAHKLSIADRLDLFVQVCLAVQHAHQKGVIHRDLKPSNVLASMSDGKPFARVIDFGIAKATGALGGRLTDKTLFTEHRQLIGTPEYMSPEQADGSPDLDTRTDVYALGVLLYELLTGATPFDAKRLRSAAFGEMQRIIKEEEPPMPSVRLERSLKLVAQIHAKLNEPIDEPDARARDIHTPTNRHTPRDLAGELDWIVMKALDKDRARRYETPSALAQDVRCHLAGEAVLAAPPTVGYRVRKFVRKNKGAVLTIGTIAAVVLVCGAAIITFARLTAQQAAIATANADEAKKQATLAEANAAEAERQAGYVIDAVAFAECGTYSENPDTNVWELRFSLPATPGALRHVPRLPHLKDKTELWVGGEMVSEVLRVLSATDTGLKNLTTLDLSGTKVTNDGLKALAAIDTGLKNLSTLDLANSEVTDDGLKALADKETGLKNLTTLDLSSTKATDDGLKVLAAKDTGLKNLATLNLYNTRVTDKGIKALADKDTGLKNLSTLNLYYTSVTDKGVKALADKDTGLKSLTMLILTRTEVRDDGLKALADKETGIKNLIALDLSDTKVSDDGLKALADKETGLKNLITLDLSDTKVTNEGLKALAAMDSGLKNLTTLDLSSTKATDDGLKVLAAKDTGLKNLATLNLYNTRVTDKGIKALADKDTGLKNLTSLNLVLTKRGEDGLKALAAKDTGLKNLTNLRLGNYASNAEGIVAVRARWPGIRIDGD